ncbi:hypothetical protein AAFF_G00232220 [Aldrovandia affinis]|uniref:NID domain-containing protein n=1 Tax=Aldrovandia affinis TaxID=143900 RepID=A0AAD7RFB8_9TELE|nr:hypothetical protein AAFF_G00232220 [Aldrovandia affinis]
MDTDFTTIEVNGVPHGLPADRMIDKLTIHFLRPRNGGGEVLRVLYPLHSPHQAIVIFERPDVAARVLQQAQVLQLERGSFPLKVRQAGCPEVDLPVRTTLDTREYRSQTAVNNILRRYGFKVSQQHAGQLLLEGTFLNLSAARVKLAQLLSSEAQSQSSFTEPRPSTPTAGATPKIRRSPDADVSHPWNGAAVHAGSRSAEGGLASPVSSSSSPPPPSAHQVEASYGQPGRPDHFLSGRTSADFPSGAPQRTRRSAGLHRDQVSCVMDAVALRYTHAFLGDKVQKILQAHQVEMEVKDMDVPDVSTVILVGHGATLARDELAYFLTKTQGYLRTQHIPLSNLSQERKRQVQRNVQMFQDIYKVLVWQAGDTIQLVGSSEQSYELKQRILGENVNLPSPGREGRTQERGRVRRSYSLPRQSSTTARGEPEPKSAVAAGYSPSKYDGEPAGRGSRQGAGGPELTLSTDSRRKRSNSESRAKVKADRPVPGPASKDKMPSGGAQRPVENEKPSKLKNLPKIKDFLSRNISSNNLFKKNKDH